MTSNYKMADNKATWTMQCSEQKPMQGTGEMIFEGSGSYTRAIQATTQGMT